MIVIQTHTKVRLLPQIIMSTLQFEMKKKLTMMSIEAKKVEYYGIIRRGKNTVFLSGCQQEQQPVSFYDIKALFIAGKLTYANEHRCCLGMKNFYCTLATLFSKVTS